VWEAVSAARLRDEAEEEEEEEEEDCEAGEGQGPGKGLARRAASAHGPSTVADASCRLARVWAAAADESLLIRAEDGGPAPARALRRLLAGSWPDGPALTPPAAEDQGSQALWAAAWTASPRVAAELLASACASAAARLGREADLPGDAPEAAAPALDSDARTAVRALLDRSVALGPWAAAGEDGARAALVDLLRSFRAAAAAAGGASGAPADVRSALSLACAVLFGVSVSLGPAMDTWGPADATPLLWPSAATPPPSELAAAEARSVGLAEAASDPEEAAAALGRRPDSLEGACGRLRSLAERFTGEEPAGKRDGAVGEGDGWDAGAEWRAEPAGENQAEETPAAAADGGDSPLVAAGRSGGEAEAGEAAAGGSNAEAEESGGLPHIRAMAELLSACAELAGVVEEAAAVLAVAGPGSWMRRAVSGSAAVWPDEGLRRCVVPGDDALQHALQGALQALPWDRAGSLPAGWAGEALRLLPWLDAEDVACLREGRGAEAGSRAAAVAGAAAGSAVASLLVRLRESAGMRCAGSPLPGVRAAEDARERAEEERRTASAASTSSGFLGGVLRAAAGAGRALAGAAGAENPGSAGVDVGLAGGLRVPTWLPPVAGESRAHARQRPPSCQRKRLAAARRPSTRLARASLAHAAPCADDGGPDVPVTVLARAAVSARSGETVPGAVACGVRGSGGDDVTTRGAALLASVFGGKAAGRPASSAGARPSQGVTPLLADVIILVPVGGATAAECRAVHEALVADGRQGPPVQILLPGLLSPSAARADLLAP